VTIAACINPVFEDWENDRPIEPFEQNAILNDYNAAGEFCEQIPSQGFA